MPTYLEDKINGFEIYVDEAIITNKEFLLMEKVCKSFLPKKQYFPRWYPSVVDYTLDSYNQIKTVVTPFSAKKMALLNGIEYVLLTFYKQKSLSSRDREDSE